MLMIFSDFRDDETEEAAQQAQPKQPDPSAFVGNPFLEIPYTANTVEYKKGYVMRKCCFDSNAKRSELENYNFCLFRSLIPLVPAA